MTVNELRTKLAQFDGNKRIVMCTDDEASLGLFEIEDISAHKGNPSRDDDGKAGFAFAHDGPVEWVFINVSRA